MLVFMVFVVCVIVSGCVDGVDVIVVMVGMMVDGVDNLAAATTTSNELFAFVGGEVLFWVNMVKYV